MKTLSALLLVVVSLLAGCAEEPAPVEAELPQPVKVVTMRDVACMSTGTSHMVGPDGGLDVLVTDEVDPYLVAAFLVAIESWHGVLHLNSIARVSFEDPYVEGRMILTSCPEAQDPREGLWALGSSKGIYINHPEWFKEVSFERRAIGLAHELGHVVGLDDSTEPYTVMNFAASMQVTAGPYPIDVCEARAFLGQAPCDETTLANNVYPEP